MLTTHPPRSKSRAMSRAAFTFSLLQSLNIVCIFAQLIIDFRYENIISATIIFFSTGFLLTYLRATDACQVRLISSFMLLGFCVTTQFGAMLGQTMTWDPVAAGLRMPVQTFGHLAGLQLVAILAHCTFRYVKPIHGISDSIANRLLSPMGVFVIPSPGNLWFLGVIGFLAQTAGASATGNVLGKALDGLRGLAWCPFLIPVFYNRIGSDYCNAKKHFPAIAAFFGLTVILGLALNMRGLMVVGATTAGLVFLMLALQDETPLLPRSYFRFATGVCVLGAAIFILGDVAKAMAISRGLRGQATRTEMLTATVELIFDRSKMNAIESEVNMDPIVGLYDERYLASPALARFVETKFHDNSFFYGSLITAENLGDLLETTRDQFVTILPEPVLEGLDIKIKKDDVFFSMGDYMSNLAYGLPMGGFKTGSALGQGISLFGYFFYPIYFFVAMILMVLNESQQRVDVNGKIRISPTIMLAAFPIFLRGLTSESFATVVNALRVIPQGLIIFALMYWLSQRFFKPYKPREAARL
jgi:hypothetical protein